MEGNEDWPNELTPVGLFATENTSLTSKDIDDDERRG